MKKSKLILSLAVSGLVLGSGATTAFAATTSTTTEGTIDFTEGTGTGVVIKPETDNEVDPETGGNTTGPLRIQHVPDFAFGTQELEIGKQTFNPTLETYKYKDASLQPGAVAGQSYAIPHFIQVSDARGTNTGWNLTASATQFTTKKTGDVMPNATITLGQSKLSNTVYDDATIAQKMKTFVGNNNTGSGKLTIPTSGGSSLVMQTITDAKADTTNGTQTSIVLNDAYDKDKLDYNFTDRNVGVQFTKTNTDSAIVSSDADNFYESVITWTLADGI